MKKKQLSSLVLLVASSFAMATPAITLPKYQVLRQNENWSVLQDASPAQFSADPWNRFKYIPTGGGSYLSLGGSMRDRVESWHNFLWDPANNDTFNLWNLFVDADLHINSQLRAFVELKSALSSNRTLPGLVRTLDEDQLALQQAFIDVTLPLNTTSQLVIRPGRQMFLFGSQRLISPLQWSNTYRTWDGISGTYTGNNWRVDGFASQFVPVRKTHFNTPSADSKLQGVYVTHKSNGQTQDIYWLYTKRANQVFLGTAGTATGEQDRRHTIGSRLAGEYQTIAYDVEAAYQLGRWGTDNIRAYMVALVGKHVFKSMKLAPQLAIGYDYASGGSPTDTTQKTFLQLFPLGHAFLGWIDYVGRQNISSPHIGLSVKAFKKTRLGVTYHYFARANNRDALYSLGSTVLRNGLATTSKAIGSEVDVYLKGQLARHWAMWGGFSYFSPGSFIKATGTSSGSSFTYLQLKYTV